ncbi:MAG: hypothetical protein ABJE10_16665 [bacterium]
MTPAVLTKQDIAALKARASELSNQIQSASERRTRTRDALRNATTAADKSGLEQRLGVLDARIARLEQDIDENGSQLASLAAVRAGTAVQTFQPSTNADRYARNSIPISAIFSVFVLAPIAFSIARNIWRRGSMPRNAVQSPEHTQRLERIEQAIDSIAIEMERVSEGQRFVTRIMTESRSGAMLGEAQRMAEPLSAPVGQRVNTPR